MIPLDWIWQPPKQKRPFAIVDNQINIRDGGGVNRPEMTSMAITKLRADEGCPTDTTLGEKCVIPYLCPAGVPTQGYGTTIDPYTDTRITLASPPITKLQALDWMMHGLKIREDEVRKVISVSLNDNQFSAIMSFAYNVGCYNFRQSTLLKKLNKGNYKGAAREFKRWNKITINGRKVVYKGLVKRRKYEANLFRTPAILTA